jgi:hypothetical protein
VKTSGIYWIRNKTNGRFYIGSSSDCITRWNRHRYYLRRNKHYNAKLQRAWNKYGESDFTFELLEAVPLESLCNIEQWYLDNTTCLTNGYNLWNDASRATQTPQMKLNKSIALKKAFAEGRHKLPDGKHLVAYAVNRRIPFRAIKDGVVVGEFQHAQEAADMLQLKRSQIAKVLLGTRKRCFGYTFQKISERRE